MKKITKTIILSWIFAVILAGCAASPDVWIYIDKSIHVPNPKSEVKIDYKTSSGVDADSTFDGEVSPDIKVTPR